MKSKGLFRAVHVVLALTWLSCPLYGGCTFVNIEGDNNTVSDTGGHGGGVTLPQGQPTTRTNSNICATRTGGSNEHANRTPRSRADGPGLNTPTPR